jgi:hypothetical protein
MIHGSPTWTHSICPACWQKRNAGEPYRQAEDPDLEICCFCGEAHRSGIYVRTNPASSLLSCLPTRMTIERVIYRLEEARAGEDRGSFFNYYYFQAVSVCGLVNADLSKAKQTEFLNGLFFHLIPMREPKP